MGNARHALRILRTNPIFTATAVLTLALGIGGNTAIFTVIRAVLLKPLEYREPERLVYLSLDNSWLDKRDQPLSLLRCEEAKKNARSFTSFGCFLRTPENMILSGGGNPEAVQGARVSADFLEILGVPPVLGRSFLREEDAPGGPPVALLSDSLWRRRFGADPQVAGKTATIDSIPYTIIGVLPPGFDFPIQGLDVWVTKPSETSFIPSRFWPFVANQIAFARLRPAVTLEQARAEMEVLNRGYLQAYPQRVDAKPGVTVRVAALRDRMVSSVRPMLWTLFGAVGFVLLIACSNLAGLLLARASSRSREFALRAALGAGRARLIRQLLAESLILSVAGGALGVLLAQWSLAALPKITALALPRAGEIELDGIVLGFTLLLSLATGALFGLFPALEASRPDLAAVLRLSGASRDSPSSWRPRELLVVAQVALSIVLLIGAVLLIRSFARLRQVEPGMQTANLLTVKIPLPVARYDTKEKRAAFFGELERRLAAVPGLQSAALTRSIPTTALLFTNVAVEGQPDAEAREQPGAQLQSVTPGYFGTMRIPLRRGRDFTARDNEPGAPPVMIVNESFARRFWPAYPAGPDPVGRHVGEGADRIRAQIVGIVADVHEGGLSSPAGPQFYVPLSLHAPQIAYIAARTAGDPLRMVNALRREVLAVDPDQAVSDIKTMEEVFDATLGHPRLATLLLAAFAGVALTLAVIGLYGVIAYSVSQRTQEVGIRRALGAERSDILNLVLRQALRLTALGIIAGLGGAFALTRVMSSLLFQVSATDPATFAGVALIFSLVALGAGILPAWRALRIHPMEALRIG